VLAIETGFGGGTVCDNPELNKFLASQADWDLLMILAVRSHLYSLKKTDLKKTDG
jgi:hypothetical protein